MVLTHGIADFSLGKTLFLSVAVKGCAVKSDGIFSAKPQMALRILGNAPAMGNAPVRNKRHDVVEGSAIVIPQGMLAATPYTALTVFVNGLYRSTCNTVVFQMVKICSVIPANAL